VQIGVPRFDHYIGRWKEENELTSREVAADSRKSLQRSQVGGFCGPGYGWQLQSETVFFYSIDGKRLAAYTPQVRYSYGTPQSIYYLLGEERVYFGRSTSATPTRR
jgi:hypothetical protein